jgi:hypothetical protein
MRAVANVTLRNDLIIPSFLFYQVAAVIAAKGQPVVLPKKFGEPGSKWMRQSSSKIRRAVKIKNSL